MQLTEQHIIKKSNLNWVSIDNLCFKSKNLYNYANYTIKQFYEVNKKYLNYNAIEKLLRVEMQHGTYFALPNNSSQQILMILDKNWKSFFAALHSFKRDRSKFEGCPKSPKYKKKDGRNLIVFTINQAKLKNGFIHFPKKANLKPIKTNVTNFQQVRIIPKNSYYVIEVVYKKEFIINENLNDQNYLSIDLGVNNLCSIVSNQPDVKPLLINGRPLKSMNQYFNKKKAKIQGQLEKNHKRKTSNSLNKLSLKRKNKIDNYLHKTSKFIISYAIKTNSKNIVIGYNEKWKQDVNLGKRNNQNFVQIPYTRLISQIQYKALLNGVNVILQEESYTSKCSALDLESIEKHETYLGKRIKRGLFQSLTKKINADVNGALNILRKVIGDDFLTNRGQVVCPIKINSL